MVEAGANEVSEEKMTGALAYAKNMSTLSPMVSPNSPKPMVKPTYYSAIEIDPEIKKFVKAEIGDLKAILYNEATKTGVQAREVVDAMILAHPTKTQPHRRTADGLLRDFARKAILDTKIRPDVARSKNSSHQHRNWPPSPHHGSAFFQEVLLTFSPLLL